MKEQETPSWAIIEERWPIGTKLIAKVKKVTEKCVTVTLEGGVTGLISRNELSWRKLNPKEIIKKDESIEAQVLKIDRDRKVVMLGHKQLTPHPWDSLKKDLKTGDKVKGKVVRITDHIAYVEIAPGIEGIVDITNITWSPCPFSHSAREYVQLGEKVKVKILALNRATHEMDLGIKQLKNAQWDNVEKRYPVGSRHTAKVLDIDSNNSNIYVELEKGIEGILDNNDLSWTILNSKAAEVIHKGLTIEVKVLEIDKERHWMRLGHKQLEKNPWFTYEKIYTINSIHLGTIIEAMDKGAVVALNKGGAGFATPKDLCKEDGSLAEEGEVLPFMVTDFNRRFHRIILSHTKTWEQRGYRS